MAQALGKGIEMIAADDAAPTWFRLRVRAWPPRHGVVALLGLLVVAAAGQSAAAEPHATWTTLGTMAGQLPNAKRSQPANLIRYGDEMILVDAGDGVAEQLAKADVSLLAVRTIFISHLHYDHTGGLYGFLGLGRVTPMSPVTVYGPPGTKRVIDGLVAAMGPSTEMSIAGRAAQGGGPPPGAGRAMSASAAIKVVELTEGSKVTVGSATVTATINTHYSFAPGSPQATEFQSLAYRFDFPGRSITYTGDTGPSPNVERLAQNTDLLVSEVSDPEGLLAAMKKLGGAPPDLKGFYHHMGEEHLTPDAVGLLAERAHAKKLVLTHIGIGNMAPKDEIPAIAAHFKGPITFAIDLDTF